MTSLHDASHEPDERDDLDRLRAAVWDDEALQEELVAITDESAFVAAIVEAGAAMGLRIEAADVAARMRENFALLMLPGVFG